MKGVSFLVLVSIIIISSCNLMHCPNKESFLTSFEAFVDKAEKKRMDKADNWTSEDAEFKDYVDRCYQEFKNDLSIEEKKLFWTKTLKFYYNRYNGDLSDAYDDAKQNLSKDFNKDINEMLKDGDRDVLKMAKDLFGNDIKKGLDSVLDAINDLGDKLKEELEKEN